jgi:hypothetical protein
MTWKPQAGPQESFVTSPVFEVIYGGARGGSSSYEILTDPSAARQVPSA